MGNFSFKNHIFHHISGTTGPIGLNFFVIADFGHPVAHTKLQPLRLKDAEDIGWCVRNARGFIALSPGFVLVLAQRRYGRE